MTSAAADPRDQHARNRTLLSNSKWNLVAFAVALGGNFLLLPFVIRHIGLESFGAAGLILAVLAPFMLVGTVLSQATLRDLARHYAAGDFIAGGRLFSAAMALCIPICFLVTLALTLFGDGAARLLNETKIATLNWQVAFAVAAVGWTAQQLTAVLQAAVAATQRYASLASIAVLATIANIVTVVVAVLKFPTVLGYLAGTSLGLMGSMLIWLLLAKRELPWLFALHKPGRHEFNSILNFGKWQGLSHFSGALGMQMDRYVLGIFSPLAVVGQYNVAMRLQEVVHMAVLKAGEVLFPHFSATSADPLQHRADFYIKVSWVLNMVAACALAPLIPLAWDVIALWVDAATADGAAPMLRSLGAAGIVGAGANVYFYHAMGTGQTARLAALNVVHAVVTVALTIVLIRIYGPSAAGLGFLGASLLRVALVQHLSKLSFEGTVSLLRVASGTLPPLFAGLLVGIGFYLAELNVANSWLSLSVHYSLMTVTVALAGLALTSMTAVGRSLVFDSLNAARSVLARRRG